MVNLLKVAGSYAFRVVVKGVERLRIAVGGIAHESNTFNPLKTGIDGFKVLRGSKLLEDEPARFLANLGVEVVPTIYARAIPSGVVERDAYLRLKEGLLRRLVEAGRVDGVCLTLHGAMTVDGVGDGESDLVKGVREVVGGDVPVSVSLDLHGNIHPEMVEEADIIVAYRTAPHTDVLETRVKAARLLLNSIKRGIKPKPIIVKPPVLLPGELVVTRVEPASTIYRRLDLIDSKPGVTCSSMLVGMAWADMPHSSASSIVVAESEGCETEAYMEACRLAEAYWSSRAMFHFEVEAGPIDEVIEKAKASKVRPIFISDSGDNVTAGAVGDIPLTLERLLALNVKDAVVGGILDPEAVEICKRVGVGKTIRVEVGGKIDRVHGYPVEVRGRVLKVTGEGAVLRVDGVDVIITSRRRSWTTVRSFLDFGIDPSEKSVLVVKLGYLTASLRRIAGLHLLALSPGCTDLLLERLNYRRIGRPLYPFDEDFEWSP